MTKRCDQDNQNGDRCRQDATWIETRRDGTEESHCTQHANQYGVNEQFRLNRPTRWRRVEASTQYADQRGHDVAWMTAAEREAFGHSACFNLLK